LKNSDLPHLTLFPWNLSGLVKEKRIETLYYDSSLHKLVLICKNCEQDTRKEVSSFTFDPSANTFSPFFKIEVENIKEQLGEDENS